MIKFNHRYLRSMQKLLCLLAILGFVPQSHANVVGTDAQNFNPITSGLDFVTVHSSETLQPGIFNLGLFLNYAVNSLPDYDNPGDNGRTSFNDSLVSTDFNMGLGLMKNWDIGVSFPQVLSQSIDDNAGAGGEYAETGLTEVRANTKFRFFGDEDHGMALILSANFNQIENNPFTGSDAGPTYNIEGAYDFTYGRAAIGFNLGYRLRSPGEAIPNVPIEPFDNQIIASAAVSYLLTDYDTKMIFEVFGAIPASGSEGSYLNQSASEILIGLKHDWNANLALHAGGGTEIQQGVASPDYRLYAGLNWTFGPLWGQSETNVATRVEGTQEAAVDFANLETQIEEEFIIREILFEFDSDEVRPEANEFLSQLVAHIRKPPKAKQVIIEGHTDSIGRDVYNLDLSRRRARSVKAYLVKNFGMDAKMIRTVGYGETKPIGDNGNYQGRRMNRRVEFKIYREGSAVESIRAN